MKPKRDIEVGDEITLLSGRDPSEIRTIARVVSRRGMVREVIYANGAAGKLRVWTDGSVQPSESRYSHMLRRTEPGDADVIAERRERCKARERMAAFDTGTAPLATVRRVLAAMEEP